MKINSYAKLDEAHKLKYIQSTLYIKLKYKIFYNVSKHENKQLM